MTKDEEKITKILLELSQLSGQMIESAQSGVTKINGQPTLFIDPDWMKEAGNYIAERTRWLLHLMPIVKNEDNPRDTPSTASE